MKVNSIGDLFQENYLAKDRAVTDTTAITLISPALDDMDGISFQIVAGDYIQPLVVEDGDSVDEDTGTSTWTFANGAFTAGMVGGTITVSGATEAGNNDTFEITAVNSATEIETTDGSPVDETFTTAVNVIVTVDGDPIQATFTVEVSDNFVRASLPGLNQIPYAGDWGVVTSKFANSGSPFFPAIAAITADGAPYYQMTPLVGRFVRWVITPTDGTGNLSFLYSAKGNR